MSLINTNKLILTKNQIKEVNPRIEVKEFDITCSERRLKTEFE